MQRLILIEPGELRTMIEEVVREQLETTLPAALSHALATPEEDRVVSRAEAMSLLQVKSRDTMIKMERSGELEPLRIGGNRVSYRLTDIKKLMRRG